MIVSFHPNIVAQENILCAGRPPNDGDRSAICRAQAVILPQGCTEALYRLSRKHCSHVFPNYDARFDFPGKVGQAGLFEKMKAPFPRTETFKNTAAYHERCRGKSIRAVPGFPCVFKSDWGGEGEGVSLVRNAEALEEALECARRAERSGRSGFLLQQYVPSGGRTLRVVVMGEQLFSYWRVQEREDVFITSLKAGARIDHNADPELQEAGRTAVGSFCSKTGINLAGFDLIFQQRQASGPLFLEINYFFGRRGLGGALHYYALVDRAVADWLARLGLSL